MTSLDDRRRGAALPIVLWVLVALGALSFAAATAARTDLALATAWADHAAALALAEAGVADALEAISIQGAVAGELEGGLSGGSYRVVWGPASGRTRVVSTGIRAGAEREVEAWVATDAAGALQIAAWREVQ